MQDLNEVYKYTDSKMSKALDHLRDELSKLRAGKAAPTMLNGVMIDYYGSMTPLNQAANINAPDAKTLVIQPWDKSMIEPIEKAIMQANLGFNPQNDGSIVRINLPPLTEERRKELVKYTRTEAENTRVSVRTIRKEANEAIKKLQKEGLPEDDAKRGEEKIQKMTDEYNTKIDSMLQHKEEEIMKV